MTSVAWLAVRGPAAWAFDVDLTARLGHYPATANDCLTENVDFAYEIARRSA